jgi:hypothetical protein
MIIKIQDSQIKSDDDDIISQNIYSVNCRDDGDGAVGNS